MTLSRGVTGRLPSLRVAPFRHALQRAPRAAGLRRELGEEQFSQFHESPPNVLISNPRTRQNVTRSPSCPVRAKLIWLFEIVPKFAFDAVTFGAPYIRT